MNMTVNTYHMSNESSLDDFISKLQEFIPQIEDLETQLEEANQKIEGLETDLNEANERIEELEKGNEDLQK